MTISIGARAVDPKKTWKESQKISPVCDFDRLCRILGVDDMNTYDDRLANNFRDNGSSYEYAYSQSLRESYVDMQHEDEFAAEVIMSGWSPSEAQQAKADAIAEEAAMKAEQEERDEAVTKYKDAVLFVAEKPFSEHDLTLVEMPEKKTGAVWRWRITPVHSWMASLEKIVTTINGVGYFEFRDAAELCRSGPWSPMMALLHHVGYVKDWCRVYGEPGPRSMIDRRMR
jgi:hypothetical protein